MSKDTTCNSSNNLNHSNSINNLSNNYNSNFNIEYSSKLSIGCKGTDYSKDYHLSKDIKDKQNGNGNNSSYKFNMYFSNKRLSTIRSLKTENN